MLSHYSKITQFRILPSADFQQYFVDISSTKEVWKNLRSAFQRARRELHIDTSYYFQGGRVGGIKIFVINNNANFGQYFYNIYSENRIYIGEWGVGELGTL